MNSAIALANSSFNIDLHDSIKYITGGIKSTVLVKNGNSQYNLFCLTAGTKIKEHTSACDAVISVVEGKGQLTLGDEDITLVPGVFVFMLANTPHTVRAKENLAFMLILSE